MNVEEKKETALEVSVQEQSKLIAKISIKDKELLKKKVARIKSMLNDLQKEVKSISDCFEVKV